MPTLRHAAPGGALAPGVCYCPRRSLFLCRKPIIEPCLPRPAKEPPSDWIHEIKHDGFRILARRDAERVRLFTRHATDFTDRFPLITAALESLPVRSCLLDGEAVVVDERGLSVFDVYPDAPAVRREAEEDWDARRRR